MLTDKWLMVARQLPGSNSLGGTLARFPSLPLTLKDPQHSPPKVLEISSVLASVLYALQLALHQNAVMYTLIIIEMMCI